MKHPLIKCPIECGEGWYDLIKDTCDLIQWDIDHNSAPKLVFTQIKEKFGTLRLYTDFSDKRQGGIIAFAEYLSRKICEVCGKPGKHGTDGYWYSTLCDDCKEGDR